MAVRFGSFLGSFSDRNVESVGVRWVRLVTFLEFRSRPGIARIAWWAQCSTRLMQAFPGKLLNLMWILVVNGKSASVRSFASV